MWRINKKYLKLAFVSFLFFVFVAVFLTPALAQLRFKSGGLVSDIGFAIYGLFISGWAIFLFCWLQAFIYTRFVWPFISRHKFILIMNLIVSIAMVLIYYYAISIVSNLTIIQENQKFHLMTSLRELSFYDWLNAFYLIINNFILLYLLRRSKIHN